MKKIFYLLLFSFGFLTSYSQIVSNDTIHWSASKKLSWSDFKGDAIDSSAAAGEAFISILANEKKGSRFSGTTTNVVTVFDWRNSWVKPKSETEAYLNYFQVMFDVGELYARKLRKSVKEANLDPYPVTFDEKYNAAKIGFNDRIKQFKKESKLGTYELAISRWAENIKAELLELDAFKLVPPKSAK